jgi:hypothetical protein
MTMLIVLRLIFLFLISVGDRGMCFPRERGGILPAMDPNFFPGSQILVFTVLQEIVSRSFYVKNKELNSI